MIHTLAVEPVFTMSVTKPLIMAGVFLAWARWATLVDKDAAYFHLSRRIHNAATLAIGAAGVLLWLVIPFFLLGLLAFITLTVAGGCLYAMTRNKKVPPDSRWHLSMASVNQALDQRRAEAATRDITLRFLFQASGSSSNYKPIPLGEDPNFEPHARLDLLLNTAILRNAQRIEVAITSEEAVVQLSVDGVSYRHDDQPTQADAIKMLDYLKGECGLDPAERRKKLVGEVRAEIGAHGLKTLRLVTAGSTRGISAVIELDPHKSRLLPFDKLGLHERQAERLKTILAETDGLVVVASPRQSGRTTTLYALLAEHDPYLLDIQTIEDPIDAKVEGTTQHTPGEAGWAKTLNSLLLRDPSVVMIEKTTDKQTAELASRAAMDGKRIYVGMPADDAFKALRGWAGAVGDLDLVSQSLRAVIAQKLVRKLCPACRQGFKPDAAALKKMNLPADRIDALYKASGKITDGKEELTCPTCNGSGFVGRTAAFEVLVIDDEDRPLLRAGDTNGLRTQLRKKKMLLMQEAALAKVVAGETSITEVMRALGEGAKK